MTLSEVLFQSYGWADANASTLLLASVAAPAVGAVAAWIGRGGKTDADGRFIASSVLGVALLLVTLEVLVLGMARTMDGASVLDANAALLAAPVLCLVTSIIGIRAVFPLSELGSVRTAADLGAFLLSCAALAWLFSKFRGFSVVFFGSFTQLVVVLAVALFFMRRMYRRAFGLERAAPRL